MEKPKTCRLTDAEWEALAFSDRQFWTDRDRKIADFRERGITISSRDLAFYDIDAGELGTPAGDDDDGANTAPENDAFRAELERLERAAARLDSSNLKQVDAEMMQAELSLGDAKREYTAAVKAYEAAIAEIERLKLSARAGDEVRDRAIGELREAERRIWTKLEHAVKTSEATIQALDKHNARAQAAASAPVPAGYRDELEFLRSELAGSSPERIEAAAQQVAESGASPARLLAYATIVNEAAATLDPLDARVWSLKGTAGLLKSKMPEDGKVDTYGASQSNTARRILKSASSFKTDVREAIRERGDLDPVAAMFSDPGAESAPPANPSTADSESAGDEDANPFEAMFAASMS